ncbi:carboxypeptidase regulatory-like domain-containing protein [Streptoalloteichus hindustanus]|uniref:Carboxypeptidase regulatory-like domain-containing protein n=1 Tax=Streptoalloteichus hindustanus TaxID=2017 RepID=A0A1M4WAM5_STRHI|nr:carboxypeptidase regulatory-like domain-containing protein [Streptoalloteichus hindustanus]SHE78210.1 hypothetical protein SAMN05444320_1011069 [Streptoalloteichus hindustanus]
MNSTSDDELLDQLAQVLERADPMPDGLLDRVRFAIDLESYLDVEVARWEHGSALAGVRSSAEPGSVTFTVDDLTVMVSFLRTQRGYRIDGWLAPPGPHTVEVRIDGHGSSTTTADTNGRFALPDVPRGVTQILVHLSGNGRSARTVVTPTLVL